MNSGHGRGRHYTGREAFWLTVCYEAGKYVVEGLAWVVKLVVTGKRG